MSNTFNVKDKLILTGWISGLLVIMTVIWILSQPLQAYYLLRSANGALISAGDSRRLTAYAGKGVEKTGVLGYWYFMHNTKDKMLVFSVFKDGILVPLGAVVAANGTVKDVIPLSLHAAKIFDDLPQNVLQIYINRIETAKAKTEGRNR